MKIIDFHSHILPGVDHGSDSLETTLAQLELSKRWGVEVIVATPHFYPHIHRLSDFISKRDAAYGSLVDVNGISVLCGAEVLLCEKLQHFEGLDALCIEGTKTLLLELPFSPFKDSYVDTVEDLIDSGYKIVLAHAERYSSSSIDSLVEVGAKIQLNASAVSGLFIKKHVRRWIDSGEVVALGSDIHMLDKKYYNDFDKAKKRLKSTFDAIMQKTEEFLSVQTLCI